MAQIIIIENNKTMREILTINLSTYAGAEIIPRENAQDAISLIEMLPNIQLIISRNEIEGEKTAEMILNHIQENDLETSLIVIGQTTPEIASQTVVVEKNTEWEKVVKASAKILGVTDEVLKKKIQPDYVPVPIDYFLPLESSCCDVYIRIKKGPQEFQFVKRVHRGDNYSKEMVRKYIEKGVKEFYVPKDEQKNFTNFVSNQLVSKLDDESLEMDKKIEVISESYSIAHNEVRKMGFTSATIQLTDSIVNSMVRTFENSPELSPLLHKVINSKSRYLYQRSHISTIICSDCLKQLEGYGSKEQDVLAYACFFNNIALVDNEALSKLHSLKSLEKANVSKEDHELVLNHAQEAAGLLKKHPEAPIGVYDIILQHHGSINGRGFDTNSYAQLTPLSRIFIVADTFTYELLKFRDCKDKTPKPLIQVLREKLSAPELEETIKALEKTIIEKKGKIG